MRLWSNRQASQKLGIHATLNAHTRRLELVNPTDGHSDKSKPLKVMSAGHFKAKAY